MSSGFRPDRASHRHRTSHMLRNSGRSTKRLRKTTCPSRPRYAPAHQAFAIGLARIAQQLGWVAPITT
jgi:hypothetical protein